MPACKCVYNSKLCIAVLQLFKQNAQNYHACSAYIYYAGGAFTWQLSMNHSNFITVIKVQIQREIMPLRIVVAYAT